MKGLYSRSAKVFKGLCLLALAAALFTGCNNPAGGDPDLTGTVSVAGTARVGEVLTANISGLEGEGAVSYQWQRGEAADGEFAALQDAVASSYTLAAADAGKYLRVAVSRTGYGGTKVSEAKGPVEALITWTAAANGEAENVTSTAITFRFSKAVSLSAGDISVTNGTGSVNVGSLTESSPNDGTVWALGISVATAGDLTVSINKAGLEGGTKTVAVYKQGEVADITWTMTVDGSAGGPASTTITFTFSGAVSLSEGDISIVDGTTGTPGSATKNPGTLAQAAPHNETVWTLGISVVTEGNLEVSINKTGVESGPETLAVYEQGTAPDIAWTVEASRNPGTADFTFTFTFEEAVSLSAGDISVTNGTGSVTPGTLAQAAPNDGTVWELGISVVTGGDVTVDINRAGIANGTETLEVYEVTVFADLTALETGLGSITGDSATAPRTVVLGAGTIDTSDNNTTTGTWARINAATIGATKYVILDLWNCSATAIGGSIAPARNQMNIIGSNTFIKGIVLPASLKIIETYAFRSCIFLESVIMPEGLERIAENSFGYATAIKKVTIPSSVTSLGTSIFQSCTSLTEVLVKAGTALTFNNTFISCTGIESVTFEDDRVTLGSTAFPGMVSLQNIYDGAGTYLCDGSTWTKK